jgi:hypothetical protein
MGTEGPTDYRSASNSYPVKTLQRDDVSRCTWSFRVRV